MRTPAPSATESSNLLFDGDGDADEARAQIAIVAMAFVGKPYSFGGDGVSDGFDCSGLTRHVYRQVLGIELPRTAALQAIHESFFDVVMRLEDLEVGDLLFFNTLNRPHSHVSIHIGEGRFVHAPRQGARIRIEGIVGPGANYWRARWTAARRWIG